MEALVSFSVQPKHNLASILDNSLLDSLENIFMASVQRTQSSHCIKNFFGMNLGMHTGLEVQWD